MLRTPTAVLMITGQMDVMKMTKIAEGLLSWKAPATAATRQAADGAQDLEDRIKAAHGPDRLADDGADEHADHGSETEAVGDALQRYQNPQARPISWEPKSKKG